MIAKIIKDFSIYGIMPYFPKLGYFFVLPIISPFLTKFDFGVYGLVFSYVSFFEMFLTLGLGVNLSNSFFKSRKQYKWIWNQIYGFLYLWSFVFLVLLVLLLSIVVNEIPFENKILIIFLVSSPFVVFSSSKEIGSNLCRLNRKPLPIMIRSTVFGLLSILILLYLVRYKNLGYMGWFWAYFIVSILENISWYLFLLNNKNIFPIFNFKRKTIIKSLKISLPILPHINSLYLLNQSDRIVMDATKVSTGEIGVYSAAYSLSSIIATLTNAYLQAVTPFAIQLLSEKKEKLLRLIVFGSQIVFFIAALFFSLISEELSSFLFRNKDFENITGLVVIITMCSIFKPMYLASTLPFSFYEKTKYFAVHSFIAGLINVVLNFIFIPIYGIKAAAITTVIGFMYLSFSRFFDKSYNEMTNVNYHPIYWILGGGLFVTFCYYISIASFIFRMSSIVILVLLIIGTYLTFQNRIKSIIKNEA